ncbi:MAG: hypothetical protein HY720_11150 [Planctomycetes bacterium]|nr:hypothetical protein [Planctomycetota bacterium]
MRALSSLALVAVILLGAAVPCQAAPPPGDVDGDCAITLVDLCLLYQMVLGLADPTPAADLNGDGAVNVADIVWFLKFAYPDAKGDTNGDGLIDRADYRYAERQVFSDAPDPDADLNNDGEVNVTDLVIMAKILEAIESGW